MTKAWRGVILLVVCVLAAGIVIGGVGWLTGASFSRIVELTVGTTEKAKELFSEGMRTAGKYWEALLSCVA